MTIVPRTGPCSASSARATSSLYQAEKSSLCGVTPRSFAIGGFYYERLPLTAPALKASRPAEHDSRGASAPTGPTSTSGVNEGSVDDVTDGARGSSPHSTVLRQLAHGIHQQSLEFS